MPVNQTYAQFSDTAFVSAYIIYVLALILSLVYYVKQQGIIDARREHARVNELVGAGGSTELPSDFADGVLPDDTLIQRESSARKLANMTQSLMWLGVTVHLVSVVMRALSASRFPFGNLYEYILMVSLFAIIGAVLILQRPQFRVIWPWILTPMLALLFYGGTELYSDSAPVVPALQSFWFPIHVSSVSIGASIGMVSGIASLLYLLRMWHPKGKEKGFFGAVAKPLPSGKTLDNLAYKTAIWTVPLFGLGIILGAIWAEAAWGRFWGWDPKETVSFITWVLYAGYLHARATAGWRNTNAAWINILALITMIFNLFFINMVVSGLHSYAGLN
ncbi:c-type cytochrome biogenesis protein CcsB [Corynebacterium crudilactis]|uniref:C-type cytochrome biogenesis protein CcsB n=1 Tax=Corynebacterium crudilactis TaxID=1652495 RepID=A0A172QX81_9CORY|nr:c-type cytochrome biogenesis protein CcsB [Corynebacterium crudilactis]ANE05240.1 c-type cytochrome biogenesis protein CcsB [Corynebacterium crudilactis]